MVIKLTVVTPLGCVVPDIGRYVFTNFRKYKEKMSAVQRIMPRILACRLYEAHLEPRPVLRLSPVDPESVGIGQA